jgi:hypothetical protein
MIAADFAGSHQFVALHENFIEVSDGRFSRAELDAHGGR